MMAQPPGAWLGASRSWTRVEHVSQQSRGTFTREKRRLVFTWGPTDKDYGELCHNCPELQPRTGRAFSEKKSRQSSNMGES